MGKRLTRITTRTGDAGATGLADGARVPKASARVEAIGDLDELNSVLGVLLAKELPDDARDLLLDVQHALFDAGGELALPGATVIGQRYVLALEQAISRLNGALPPLAEFILPGGGEAAALCHLARAVCRRAERRLWSLQESEEMNVTTAVFMNRLSDLLFVLARALAREAGAGETPWERHRWSDPG